MKRKVNVNFERVNKRSVWLQRILLNISDEELLLYLPSPSSKVVEMVKTRAAVMQFSMVSKN